MADEIEHTQPENAYVAPIADPMLDGKLLDKSIKLIKKTTDVKKSLKRGIGEVTKAIRKGQKGVCFLAADVYPNDIISHLPVLCEQKGVAYAFIPNRKMLGLAAKSKRPASALFCVKPSGECPYEAVYEKVDVGVRKINVYV